MGFSGERSIRRRIVEPAGRQEFLERVASVAESLPPRITCLGPDQHELTLGGHNVDWHVRAAMSFRVGPIPAYNDDTCGITYIPEAIFSSLEECVKRGLYEMGASTDFEPPQHLQSVSLPANS